MVIYTAKKFDYIICNPPTFESYVGEEDEEEPSFFPHKNLVFGFKSIGIKPFFIHFPGIEKSSSDIQTTCSWRKKEKKKLAT